MINKKLGFTLIELISVIVIIGIIALISTPVVLNIINESKKASFKNSVLSVFKASQLYEAENEFQKLFKDGINITDEKLLLENNNFISGKIFRNENNKLELLDLTDGIYCAKGTMTDLRVIKGGCYQLDETSPVKIELTIDNITSNSFRVIVSAEDNESGIKNYSYSIDGINYKTTTSNNYTFSDLEMDRNYTVFVRVTNNNVITSEDVTKDIITKSLIEPIYSIDKTGWQTSKTVIIEYPERETGFVYSYSIDGGATWETVENGTTANVIFTSNGNVIARIYDGTNYKIASSYTVSEIDTTAPSASVALSNKTTNTITVKGAGSDAESGVTKYEFSIDGGSYISNGTNDTYTFTGVTTGNHTVRVRVTNGSGLTTESTGLTVSPNDITAPTYSIDKSGWQTQKIVTIDYPARQTGFVYSYSIDGGDTWETVESGTTANITFTSNGNVIARVYDGTNYKIASTYTVNQIDTTAPSASVALTSKTTNTITVKGSGSDAESGVTKYEFSIDGGAYKLNGTTDTYTFTGVTTGNHIVRVRVTNGSGLTTESTSLSVSPNDITAPTYSIDKSGWQTQKIVTINYPTRQTGFVYSYSIDGGDTWETVESGTTANITFTSNGNVIARIYDGTNYKTASTYTVSGIDTTAPSASVALSSKTTNTVTVKGSGSDTESGVTKYEFSIDGREYVSNGTNDTYTFTGVTTGNHTVRVRVTNGSGLSTESTGLTVSPNDITVPTYSIDKSGWQTQKIVTIDYPARQTGFVYSYSIDGGSSWTTVSSGTTATHTFNANGSVIARIYDGTNYKSASSYTVSQIDTTVPSATIALSSKTTNTITVTATGIDSESGITKYEFSIDGGSYISNGTTATYIFTSVTAGSHTVRVRVTNGSGLTTESIGLTVSPNDIVVPTYSIDKTDWQVQKIVTITYPTRQTGFVYQYSTNGGSSWTTVSSGVTATVTFTSNGSVIARVYDGTNYKTASSYTVSQIETTLPTISAKGASYTITEGANNVISSTYFNIAANGSAPISSTTCVDTSNSNVGVTNTSTLSVGTHLIRCTVTKVTGLSANATTTIVVESKIVEYVFNYTGSLQTFNVPRTGTYKLEVWGAQGGGAQGGKGGYSVGTITLTAGNNLYVEVGGRGNYSTSYNTSIQGGYGGGGSARNDEYGYAMGVASGGGGTTIYSHPEEKSILISNFSSVSNLVLEKKQYTFMIYGLYGMRNVRKVLIGSYPYSEVSTFTASYDTFMEFQFNSNIVSSTAYLLFDNIGDFRAYKLLMRPGVAEPRLIVAGGGGGQGVDYIGNGYSRSLVRVVAGGVGGGANGGGSGGGGQGTSSSSYLGGKSSYFPVNGGRGFGGSGENGNCGGGGGGYVGGTGGMNIGYGSEFTAYYGGGGSGYIGGVTDGSMSSGVQAGNGYAKITFIGQ